MIEITKLTNIDEILKQIDSTKETNVVLRPETFENAGPWADLIVTLRKKGIFAEFFPIRKLNARNDEDNHFTYVISECGTNCHWDILR